MITTCYRGYSSLILLWALLGGAPARAWSLHYLVTDRALALPGWENRLADTVKVESLDSFVTDRQADLAPLFAQYYAWLEQTGAKRFKPVIFDAGHPGSAAFLRAARLNPTSVFSLVNRVLPGQISRKPSVSFAQIDPFEKMDPNVIFKFEDVTGQSVTARSVVVTFADEPDWWIDRDLFENPEYGYGQIPYGKPTGESAAAPFHTQFAHENLLVRLTAAEITEGMASQRLELFTRLSRRAFRSGHPYWGYRFAAWAIHYAQDLTQPYHSKAVPLANLWFYVKFAVSGDKLRIKRETSQLVYDRHRLYEDLVMLWLQDSYFQSEGLPTRIAHALKGDEVPWSDLDGSELTTPLFTHISAQAAKSAHDVDLAVTQGFGPTLTQDPQYDLEQDPRYDSRRAQTSMSTAHFESLASETVINLRWTGQATRTLLSACLRR